MSDTRRTPADFQRDAQTFNDELAELLQTQATAMQAVTAHMAQRETLIAAAKDYGVTGSYARTLLRKP